MRRGAAVLAMLFVLSWGAGARAAEQVVQIAHGGLTLNGKLVLAEGKTVKNGVVLVTHGTLAHNGMEVMRAVQSRLSERGLNSLAVTLSLGLEKRSGMYDCAIPHRHKHTDALDEIGAWLNWLKGQGASTVVLMGHSRGGAQTARFAAERPDPAVSKVVLLAPMLYDEQAERTAYQVRFGRPLSEPLARAQVLVASGRPNEVMANTGFLYCPEAKVTGGSFVSYYQPDVRLGVIDSLSCINIPTLVVAAGDDQVVKGLPEAVSPLADGRRLALMTIPGADHMFLDLFADDAADAIKAFLAQ